MLNILSNNQPVAQFITVVFVVLHATLLVFTTDSFSESYKAIHQVSFYAKLWETYWLSYWLNVIIVIISVIFINYIFNTREFFDRNTYLPGFLYFILLSFFLDSNMSYDLLLTLLLYLLAIYQILKIRQNEEALKLSFNAMFFIGLAAFFIPMYFFFIIFFWLILTSVRPLVWREISLSIAGVLVAMLFVYVFTAELNFWEEEVFLEVRIINVFAMVNFSAFALLMLASTTYYVLKYANKTSLRFKRLVRILYILLLFGMIMSGYSFFYFNNFYLAILLVPTLAILCSIPFLYAKRTQFFNYFLWLLLLASFSKFIYAY
jgi:hypothetical protein